MQREFDCPMCPGTAVLTEEDHTMDFLERKNITVRQVFYHCENCREDFTTTETDNVTLGRLAAAYKLDNPHAQSTIYDHLIIDDGKAV